RSSLNGPRRSWLILRNEVLRGTWHAVIIRPAIDHREFLAPVAVSGRRLRRLPLQCCRPPWIATRSPALEQSPDKIKQEDHLAETHGQCHHGDKGIQRMGRWRDERHFADIVIPARDSEQPKIVHGKEDQVGTE